MRALDNLRCHECGAYLPSREDSDVRTEVPATLLGSPVYLICEQCFRAKYPHYPLEFRLLGGGDEGDDEGDDDTGDLCL
jgi:hypothetical protein